MSGDEPARPGRVGQVFMVGIEGLEVSEDARRLIQEHGVGAIILFARNIESPGQVAELTAGLQGAAKEAGRPSLLVAVDQEGGAVQRILAPATEWPGNLALGAADDEDLTKRCARAMANELLALGINWNLAPVLDVNTNPANPIIGVRSFGSDPERVAALGASFIRGMQDAGAAACGKHFPGHGDTSQDSHVTLPTVPHARERLERVELVPFRAAVEAGVASIMTAHVTFPAVEPQQGLPATLSSRVIEGLLRQEMGFHGAVVADALEMAGIADYFGISEGAVRALAAGADVLPVCSGFDRQVLAIRAVAEAVAAGRVPEKRLEEAAGRVAELKAKYADPSRPLPPKQAVGSEENLRLARETALRAVTVARDRDSLLPLRPKAEEVLAAIWFRELPLTPVSSEMPQAPSLPAALRSHHDKVAAVAIGIDPSAEEIEAARDAAARASAAIIGVADGHRHPAQVELARAVASANPRCIALSTGYPAELELLPEIGTAAACYCWRRVCLDAACNVLFGKTMASGKMPVAV
jgi:beta-N-acetylhexosaminidase